MPRPVARRAPRRAPTLGAIVAGLAAASAAPAHAQPRPPVLLREARDTAARALAPVVVVGARSATTVGGAAEVVVRPDSLPIPLQPAPPLDQVLRQTPFVLVRQNSRGEVELSVRGSDSRQAALLLDGLPLTLGWDHRSDASLVPTTGVRRVTLVRGLASLLDGPNTLGGVLSVELNAPAARDAAGRPAPELALGTGVDQFAARVVTGAGGAPVAVGRGTLTARGGATYRQRDGFALSRGGGAGDGATGGAADPGNPRDAALRTNTDLRQRDGFAALRYDAPGGAYAGLTATAFAAERGVAPELHVAAPRFWRYPSATRRLGVLSLGTGARATPLGRGRADASVGAFAGGVDIESFTSRSYDTLATRELGAERSGTARLVAEHTVPGLPAGARVRAGGTLSRVSYLETLDAQRAAPTVARYRQRLSSAGAELELPAGSRALVSGGVVRDGAETPESGGRPPLGARALWGWRGGATVFAAAGVRVHASASRRARFPALRELYSGALNRFDPNPALRPERLTGVEGGVTLAGARRLPNALTLQAVGFHHQLDDAVVRVTLPNRLFRRVNRDQIRSTGLELLAGWAPRGPAGWSLSGDLLAQRVRVANATLPAGEPNARRAEHQPGLRGSLDLGVPLWLGVRGSAMARYTGRQFCQHPDLGRQVALGARTVGDAALARRFRVGGAGRLVRALRAVAALDNVGDVTAYDQCGLPQPGRTLRVAVELR